MAEPTPQQVLDCPMDGNNEAEATTIREYLIKLLLTLWQEGEDFSGKRPLGNSGWEYDLYTALGQQDWIIIEFDEDGYVTDCDTEAGRDLIAEAIRALR